METFLAIVDGRVLLAPGMLPNSLQCTGQPLPRRRALPAPDVPGRRFEKADSTHVAGFLLGLV